MAIPHKVYLGDSVYAELDLQGRIILTTENGLPTDPSNTIILEPEVMLELWHYFNLVRNVEESKLGETPDG